MDSEATSSHPRPVVAPPAGEVLVLVSSMGIAPQSLLPSLLLFVGDAPPFMQGVSSPQLCEGAGGGGGWSQEP